MSALDDTLNHAESWKPMAPPLSFGPDKVKAYQNRINNIAGTRDGRSIIKLAWAPDELRWRPHPLPDPPPGYTFPIFFYGWDAEGKEVAAPRWVLLERFEPQQYASTWEVGRYSVHGGRVWDWKGPCPLERYTELWSHSYHDGECCPCHGEVCECGIEYDHCWGRYLDPNERLLDRIRRSAWRLSEDPSDKVIDSSKQEKDAVLADLKKETTDYWLRQPKTVNTGLKRTESGLYLLS